MFDTFERDCRHQAYYFLEPVVDAVVDGEPDADAECAAHRAEEDGLARHRSRTASAPATVVAVVAEDPDERLELARHRPLPWLRHDQGDDR